MSKAEEKVLARWILEEQVLLHEFLKPLGLTLHGWNTVEWFTTIDPKTGVLTEWTPVHVAAIRKVFAMGLKNG